MPEDTMYATGLSGVEIIKDLNTQIAAKLRNDCNLRESDSYTGGYSAEVKLKINLYGLDAVETTIIVHAGKPKQETPSAAIDEEFNIVNEPDLDAVRERADLPEPTLEAGEKEPRQKRKYNKTVPALSDGGATGATLEQE